MARKVFWVLWMTVWPIAALVPHLVTAQSSSSVPREPVARSTAKPATSRTSYEAKPSAKADRLASAKESRIPLLADTDPELEEVSPKLPPATLETTSSSKDRTGEASTEESLPPARDRLKAAPRRSSTTTARSNPRTGPEMTLQEERAQKLIHERAISRGLQRHARLEMKSRRASNLSTLTPRWQPHLTETNWVAGSRQSSQP